MKISLPRGLNIDIDNVPDNLEELVQKAFGEYTAGTNPVYMHHDKLCFIDVMVKRMHRADSDKVNDLIKDAFGYQLDEYGELMEPHEFLSVEEGDYTKK